MKNVPAIFLTLMFLASFLPASHALSENIYFDIPIKLLHEEPSEESPVAFEIPIDVTLLGMTADRNWYKVRVEYDLLFLGHYVYTGWVRAPLAKYLQAPPPLVKALAL
jgi:hypothetical protein